jgi:phosphoribosyl 1,2-cyclic phosphodiesterase
MEVTFHGVRGSTPCQGPDVARYGGNTSSVSVHVPGHDPVLFDIGTGARYYGLRHGADALRAVVFLSHLHWDHIQGLPFFTPLNHGDSTVAIYAPRQDDGRTVGEALADAIRPPVFPIHLAALAADLALHDVGDETVRLGDDLEVMSRIIPHVGPTCGYRLTWRGRSVTYMSDHQMPVDGSFGVTDAAMELMSGADLLIHDAQYTPEEFACKRTWGHSTLQYAVWVAAEAGVRRLALFHHDPMRNDDELDDLVLVLRKEGERRGVEVFAAAEGQTVPV